MEWVPDTHQPDAWQRDDGFPKCIHNRQLGIVLAMRSWSTGGANYGHTLLSSMLGGEIDTPRA